MICDTHTHTHEKTQIRTHTLSHTHFLSSSLTLSLKGKIPKAERISTDNILHTCSSSSSTSSCSFTTSYTHILPSLTLILFPSIVGINIHSNILSKLWDTKLTCIIYSLVTSLEISVNNCESCVKDDYCVVVFSFHLPVFSILKHKCITV